MKHGKERKTMTLHGWIIYNGHLPGTSFLEYANWMQLSASQKGVTTEIVKNNHLFSYMDNDGNHLLQTTTQQLPDFVIFADKDIALAKQLESLKIPVFNSADVIDTCDNKITTYQKLAARRLPIPRTIIGPKIFPGNTEVEVDTFTIVEDYFDYPVILKEAYGSFGQQVYLIHTKQELISKINELKETPFLIQEFIDTSYGRDIRLNVVGGRVVASMLRYSENDFRPNLPNGKMSPYQPTEEEIQLALDATEAIGADFAGIDLLFSNNGPVICEVNSNAHIKKTFQSTGINVADFIIEHIRETIA